MKFEKISFKEFSSILKEEGNCLSIVCGECPANVIISNDEDCIIRHKHGYEIRGYNNLGNLPERYYINAIKELKEFLNIKETIQEEMEI